MAFRKNESGQLLMDLEDEAAKVLGDRYSRYNGGWIKSVNGLYLTVTTGYSLKGDFVPTGESWISPGIYLDCSIDGSRKNQERRFTMFVVKKDGSIKIVGPKWKYGGSSGGDWAVKYWDTVEALLKDPHFTDPEERPKLEVLREREANLVSKLEKVRAEIQALEAEQSNNTVAGE